MKKRTILLAFIISAVAVTSGCSANEPKTDEVKQEQTKTESVSSGVTIKPLTKKAIDENPYMAKMMQISTMIVIIQIQQMRYCLLVFTQKLMFLMKR